MAVRLLVMGIIVGLWGVINTKGGYSSNKLTGAGTLLDTDITIVTSYVDIGRFSKGENDFIFFDPYMYRRWMAAFKFIKNPVIAYFEDAKDVQRFTAIRASFPKHMTKIIKFDRKDTWAFSLAPKISNIFSQPSYPVHHPNTVNANYSCVMHLKYEFLANAVKLNPFKTAHFAWVDIGYYRDLLHIKNQSEVQVHLPPNFNLSTIAVNQVFPRDAKKPITTIFYNNIVWLGGGFFLGKAEVVLRWAEQYRKAVGYFITEMMMNTDQQILYAWYNQGKNDVPLTVYKPDGRFNSWFHLGLVCIA